MSIFSHGLDVVKRKLGRIDRRIEFRDNLRAVVATPHGRAVFEQLLRDCNVTRPVFTADPLTNSFNEGRRQLAMSYLAILEQDDLDNLRAALAAENETKKHTSDE